MINIIDDIIVIKTKTLIAEMRDGKLTSVKSKITGETYLNDPDSEKRPPLQLVYTGNNRVDIDPNCRNGQIEYLQISETRMDICFHTWNGSGILSLSEDQETGDLIIEPSAFSTMPGVRSVRFDMAGFREDAKLVAPLFQGIMVDMDDPLIRNSRFIYPYKWESPFVALQSPQGGLFVYTKDTSYHFRTLNVGDNGVSNRIGLEAEASGPITNNLSCGSCAWRINVYQGDWMVPVKKYKAVLWSKLNLADRERKMPDWMKEVRLAYSWCPTDRHILSELKRYINPQKVLIHLPRWREGEYDKEYPNYLPSADAIAFIKEATAMGYHVAPHFNAYEIDPTRKEFALVRDFRYRDLETRRGMGWAFDCGCVPIPEDNCLLSSSQHHNVMAKIHPGHAMWRYLLEKNILDAVNATGTDTIFIDVTHNIFNLDNEYVNNLSCGEGAIRLLKDAESLGNGLCVGGEGLNEIVAQGQFFAQGHVFAPVNGADASTVTVEKVCPINQILYEGVCHIIGYHPHIGDYNAMRKTHELDQARGFIPTLIGVGFEELQSPQGVIKQILDGIC